MHRENLLEKLRAYEPIDKADRACRERFVDFVRSHPDCFERSLQHGHVTGSAWIVDPSGRRALLTHHRKLDKWIQLGGHSDGDPDVLAVALREAREESGLPDLRPVSEQIFDLDIHPIPARGPEPEHLHFDVRFALQAHGSSQFVISAESIDLAWIEFDALPGLLAEESVLRMLTKWRLRAAARDR